MTLRNAIITGFEPFGPYKYNPTQDIAKEYVGKIISDIKITSLVLPCTYYGASKILSEQINELSPSIVISCGLASNVKRIRLESLGKNIMNGKYADAEGFKPSNNKIVKRAKKTYSTTADNIRLTKILYEEKIHAEVSYDAEGFICNSLIYLTAKKIYEENLPIKFAFFHIPWTDDYLDRIILEKGKVTLKKNDLRKTIDLLITELAK